MYKVAIIGADQLGSRHLQGLKTAVSPLSISVVDSSNESLQIAKERYDTVQAVGEKYAPGDYFFYHRNGFKLIHYVSLSTMK